MQISKLNLIQPWKFSFIIAMLIFPFLFQACKKADIVNGTDKNSPATVSMQAKDFFTISMDAPDAEKSIVKEMQKQFKENDVLDFLKWHGQPLWRRIIKFEEDKNGSVTYAIPTQKNNEITRFFAATIDKANAVKLEMHRKAAIALKKGEYTYADINSDRSIAIFNIFNNKTKNSEQTNSLFLHCWFEWVEQTTFQKTTTSNMESVVHHPRGYWELICMETSGGGGGTGGGGGGTGGDDTGGGGTGGCGGGGGHEETFNYKWWSNESSLLSPCNLLEAINRLSYFLELNTAQLNWLRRHPSMIEELDRYIGGGGSQQTNQIAKDDLDKMMNDNDYLLFVESHENTGDPLKMWWEDDNWLNNPNNFNLDITRSPTELAELNAAEKALIVQFPIQAYVISTNKQPAFDQSDIVYGVNTIGLNTKKDAFRHAFFNAINTRDVPPQLFPIPLPASTIVRLFGEAHETTTPTALNLEKQMDLFNNEVGINYCSNCYSNSNTSISNAILAKLLAGELRYLFPIDFTGYGTPGSSFWDNPNTTELNDGHHGINQNPNQPTVLTPTN